MANLIFKNPLVFTDGTGFNVEPNSELFAEIRETITFSIGQSVATTSNVVFNQITPTNQKIIIDDGGMILQNNAISGSFTLTGDMNVSSNLIGTDDLTILGSLTAEKIETEVTQSVTLFESGSTQFGDTSDDTHQFSGSLSSSGSLNLNNYELNEISNDTSFTDGSTVAIPTENATKIYVDSGVYTDAFHTYARKSFVYVGSFVNVSTASFSAVTASAPTGYTSTSEEDFIFFNNGQMMEYDAISIEQSGSTFLLKVNNSAIGYDLSPSDEFVAWGKFNS